MRRARGDDVHVRGRRSHVLGRDVRAAEQIDGVAEVLQRRGDRKRIVAPDGSTIVPSSKPGPDGTLIKALARALRAALTIDARAADEIPSTKGSLGG